MSVSKQDCGRTSIDRAKRRAEGCLAGLACGDAVGATVEFVPRGRFAPLTDMVGGGRFRLAPGRGFLGRCGHGDGAGVCDKQLLVEKPASRSLVVICLCIL